MLGARSEQAGYGSKAIFGDVLNSARLENVL
jgi:hypothetical protein